MFRTTFVLAWASRGAANALTSFRTDNRGSDSPLSNVNLARTSTPEVEAAKARLKSRRSSVTEVGSYLGQPLCATPLTSTADPLRPLASGELLSSPPW